MRIKKLDLDLLEREKSRELRAKRRVLSRVLEGLWSALLKGRGMEFAGFRQYTPSDDASRIDWGASLRANDVLVREYEEFKNVNILFLLDVSDTMLFTSQKKLKAEYGAELMFDMVVSLVNNGDTVGFGLFSDGIITDELPNIGHTVINRVARALMDPKHYGGKKNLGNVVNHVNARLNERSLIILISDFIGFEEGWDRYIRMMGQKFDLIGIMLRDPHDRYLPDSGLQAVLRDPYTGERMFVDFKDVHELFQQHTRKEEEYIKSVFDKARASFVPLVTDGDDLLRPIIKHFRRRSAVVAG